MIYLMVILALASGDLAVKWWIEQQDPADFPRPLAHTKNRIWLYRNHNAGFPFGFLEQYGEVVRMAPLVMISALGGVLGYLVSKKGHLFGKISLTLLLGGAISNLYDRLVRRYVVDYFSIQAGVLKRVVFNLGDILVFAGSLLLLVREVAKEIQEGKCSKK